MRSKLIAPMALAMVALLSVPVLADGESETRTYEVTIRNRATSQPISPPVVVTHDRRVRLWRTGAAASDGLVAIAENGDPSVAFAALDGASGVTDVVNVGQPLTRKGTVAGDFTDTVTFQIEGNRGDVLSLAGMLICTNDGFAGIDSVRLPNHGSRTVNARAYDAGSEINSERSIDIVDACSALGPVVLDGDDNGNENDAVDASGVVRAHRGVVGESDLLVAHNWRRSILKVTIKVVEDN